MFTFKQFTIHQNACAMKVGTDGVLLGAWCPVENAVRVLDVGTGTGLIALMIAQRVPQVQIEAVELDERAAEQARYNVSLTPWKNRIKVIATSVQQFAESNSGLYDAVVCNPPYFVDSLKSPDDSRTKARHADTLTHDDLLRSAQNLLSHQGALYVILPTVEADIFIEKSTQYGFSLAFCTHVLPTPQSAVKRKLMGFVRESNKVLLLEKQLVIEQERHLYTDEYKALTKEFYLKL